jgi:hypothetical protein
MRCLLSFTAILLIACNTSVETPNESDELSVQSGKHNTITEEEIINGWELMFDGQCTGNFRKYGDSALGSAWVKRKAEVISFIKILTGPFVFLKTFT